MEEEIKEEIVTETVRVKKAKKPVPYSEFMAKMFPMELKNIDDDITIIIRPDMAGCTVEGLAPYGSYAKIVVDRKKEVLNVWTLEGDKENPNFRIVNGVIFSKD